MQRIIWFDYPSCLVPTIQACGGRVVIWGCFRSLSCTQTDRQTNAGKNITSLAEVMKKKLLLQQRHC
uniref:Uncharacterized protein n=1 Tax=Sphaeramia orbicularis TaxID=375764 RepID=A0A673BNI1_9TELE